MDSILNLSFDKDLIEIIVVNNSNKILVLEERYTKVRIFEEKIPTSYAARNKGAVEAKGEYFAFLDSDCYADKDWIKSAKMLLCTLDENVFLAGEIKFEGIPSSAFAIYQSLFEFKQQFYSEKLSFAATANMIVRRDIFFEVGQFNSWQYAGADTAWGVKAKEKMIHPVYAKNSVVYHKYRVRYVDHLRKTIKSNQAACFNIVVNNFAHAAHGLSVREARPIWQLFKIKTTFLKERIGIIMSHRASLKNKLFLYSILAHDVFISMIVLILNKVRGLGRAFNILDRYGRS